MKRLTILFVLCFPVVVSACDVCNLYIGIQPNDFKNTIGLNYRSRNLHKTFVFDQNNNLVRHVQSLNSTADVWQQYKVFDLQGRYYLNRKTYLLGSLPIVRNIHIRNDSTIANVNGLGDFILSANHRVFEKITKHGNKSDVQRVFIGAGIKFPVGNRHLTYNDSLVDLEMQGSSGSWDFLGILQYQALFDNFGILSVNTYKLNTTGTDHYQFGSSFNSSILFFKKIAIRKVFTLAPQTGFYFESAKKDKWYSSEQVNSGGWVLLGSFGFNLYTESFNIQLNWQPACLHKYPDYQVPVNSRVVMGITFNL